jgi:hypothetical protein
VSHSVQLWDGSAPVPGLPSAWQTARTQVKQLSTQEAVLLWCTILCVLASMVFWGYWYVVLLLKQGSWVVSLLGVLFALCSALVIPIIFSMLIPSTPLGAMLARTRYRTPGILFLGAAATLFFFYSWDIFRAFWAMNLLPANPPDPQADAAMGWWLSVVSMLLLQGLPAFAWVQATPESLVQQVIQAHQVEKMRLQMQMELEQLNAQRDELRVHHKQQLIAVKAAYHTAIARLRLPLAQQTAQTFQEVAGILRGMHLLEADTINGMVVTVEELAGTAAAIPQISTPALAANYDKLAQHLQASHQWQAAAYDAQRINVATGELQLAALAPPVDPEYPPEPLPQPSATVRHGPQRTFKLAEADADVLRTAQQALPTGAWKRSHLEEALRVQKSKAADLIQVWKAAGAVCELENPKYHYVWTEGGAR